MTSPSPLERLAGPGNVLGKEAPDAKEFEGLVRSGLARLKDSDNEANSLESRFDLAYGAAHVLSKCHDMRDRTEYEGALDVDERLVLDLIGACRKVAAKVRSLPPIQEKSK
jgi:hypothetical protein